MYVFIRIYMILYNPHYSTSFGLVNLNNSSSIIYFHTYLSLLLAAAAAAKSLQSCPTLWDPRDSSPPGPTVPGILQAPLKFRPSLTLAANKAII